MGLKRVTTTTHLFVDGGYIYSGTSLSMNWILVILGKLPSFLKRSEQYVHISMKEFGVTERWRRWRNDPWETWEFYFFFSQVQSRRPKDESIRY